MTDHSIRVLLADDHDLVRDAIGALLLQDEPLLDLVTVEDLPQALNEIRKTGSFDAIVLDLKMPGMNGLVGAQKMMDAAKGIPVIIRQRMKPLCLPLETQLLMISTI